MSLLFVNLRQNWPPSCESRTKTLHSGASVLKYGLSRLAAPHGTVSVGEPRRAHLEECGANANVWTVPSVTRWYGGIWPTLGDSFLFGICKVKLGFQTSHSRPNELNISPGTGLDLSFVQVFD